MGDTDRELVITIPLHKGRERGDPASTAAQRRRFLLDLGPRLRAFRADNGLTQAEVARVVGARTPSTVTQWEAGVNVPDGMRRERLRALLNGQLRPELRAAMIDGEGMPGSWERAVRWYRRASRERRARETIGRAVAAVLDGLRAVETTEGLRGQYLADEAGGARAAMAAFLPAGARGEALRRAEDAAHGLRRLELARGARFDLGRSLARQLPLAWLDSADGDGEGAPMADA
jgi:transcriptional regulator with XRE-family HTH domain